MRDARYLIDRREGYERVDLLLSDATATEPCGALDPVDPSRIWLRRDGAQVPAEGEVRISPARSDAGAGADGSWEVHYQLKQDGRWVGHDVAGALLRLSAADGSLDLAGALSVCFADGQQSCAAGTFVARNCPSELDRPLRGRQPSEKPSSLPLRPSPGPSASAAASTAVGARSSR